MDDLTRAEIERLWDENHRQNHRLEIVEQKVTEIQTLTLSVQRLADSMDRMCAEQTKQGARLEKLESRPAEAWNTMQKTIFTTIISAIGGGLAVGLVQMIASSM